MIKLISTVNKVPWLVLLLPLLVCTGCQLAPTTPTVNLADRPLKGSGPAIYLLIDSHLRHIGDWATFQALGYTAEDIVSVSDAELARYSLGPPLTRWLSQLNDRNLYFLHEGQRYRVPDVETIMALSGELLDVALVPENQMARLPLADEPLPLLTRTPDDRDHPQVTAAIWANGFLW